MSDWPDPDLHSHPIAKLHSTTVPWEAWSQVYGADHVDEPTWGYNAGIVGDAMNVLRVLGYRSPFTLYWYGDEPFPAYVHPRDAGICAVIAPTLGRPGATDLADSVGRSSIVIEENPSKAPSAPRWGLSAWPPTFRRRDTAQEEP